MLSEQKRLQLDGIVKQMVNNNESDDDINFVVNDFKQKYKDAPEEDQGFIEKTARFLAPKAVENLGESIGDAIAVKTRGFKDAEASQAGLEDMNIRVAQRIKEMKSEGKDTTKLEGLLKRNSKDRFDVSQAAPSVNKSAKQVYGEAVGTLGAATLGASPMGTVGKRLAMGAGQGATFGVGGAMERDEPLGNVVTSGLTGAMVGLALGGVFEGAGALAKKVVPKIGKNTFNKKLQPKTTDVTKAVEKGFKTFGEKVRNVKDAKGNGVYKGTYTTMLGQAKEQLKRRGKDLNSLLKKYDPKIKVTKAKVAGDIIENLQDTFGKLSPAQIKSVNFEINRLDKVMEGFVMNKKDGAINGVMNGTGMLNAKRMYDGLIPDSFWLKAGDANVAFNTQAKYILRDNLRKLINEQTDDVLVNKFNNELSIAMDVRHLTATQIAQRMKGKVAGEGGFFYRTINKFIEDILLNPAITTRVSHATHGAGQKTGQTPLRSAVRGGIIKESTE